MKHTISRNLAVFLLVLAFLALALLIIRLNSWSYHFFPLVLFLMSVMVYSMTRCAPHLGKLVKKFKIIIGLFSITSVCRCYWSSSICYLTCIVQLSKVKRKLQYSNKSLAERNAFLILGDERSGSTDLLQVSGNLILSEPSKNDLSYWDIGGQFYLEVNCCDFLGTEKIAVTKWGAITRALSSYVADKKIQSVIICVNMETLINRESAIIVDAAHRVRSTIASIQASANVIIPLHIIVTNCNKIDGLDKYFSLSSILSVDEGIGYCAPNSPRIKYLPDFVDNAFLSIYRTLSHYRLSLPIQEKHKESCLKPYFIPEKIKSYQKNIEQYLYAVIPDIAVRRSCQIVSLHFSKKNISQDKQKTGLSEWNAQTGIRINTSNLWHDSNLLTMIFPNYCYKRWEKVADGSRYGGLLSKYRYIVMPATYCLIFFLVSMVFIRNLNDLSHLERIERSFVGLSKLDSDSLSGIDEFGTKISKFSNRYNSRWVPNFGFEQVARKLTGMKQYFIEIIDRSIMYDSERYLERSLQLISDVPSPGLILQHAKFLHKRINILKSGRDIQKYESTRFDSSSLDFNLLVPEKYRRANLDLDKFLTKNYEKYLTWQSDDNVTLTMLSEDQRRLNALITNSNSDMSWISNSIESNPNYVAYSLNSLLSNIGLDTDKHHIKLDATYTKLGRDLLLALLDDIDLSKQQSSIHTTNMSVNAATSLVVDSNVSTVVGINGDIMIRYNNDYLSAWKRYLEFYKKGISYISGEKLSPLVNRIAECDSLYNVLILQAYSNLLPIRDSMILNSESVPRWLTDIMILGQLVEKASVDLLANKSTSLSSVLKESELIVGKLSAPSVDKDKFLNKEKYDDDPKVYIEFKRGLSSLIEQSRTTAGALALIDAYSKSNTSSQESISIQSALDLLSKVEASYFQNISILVRSILRAQFLDVMRYIVIQSEKQINVAWDKLVDDRGAIYTEPTRLLSALQSKGIFWNFYQNFTKNLVTRNKFGTFRSKNILGYGIDFTNTYLNALQVSANIQNLDQKTFEFIVEAIPTGVNTSSTERPSETRLKIYCGHESVEIINKNYPVRRRVLLEPLRCSEVSIEVRVGSLTLLKQYTGDWSFFNFRSDFLSGVKILGVNDITVINGNLADYGVTDIRIGYRIKESADISILSQLKTITFPNKITRDGKLVSEKI